MSSAIARPERSHDIRDDGPDRTRRGRDPSNLHPQRALGDVEAVVTLTSVADVLLRSIRGDERWSTLRVMLASIR